MSDYTLCVAIENIAISHCSLSIAYSNLFQLEFNFRDADQKLRCWLTKCWYL